MLDTIAAIATPLGVGGIGIIRLSGPDSVSIAQSMMAFPISPTPRHVHYVSLIHPETHDPIDDGCLIYFQGPHSFTGEDVVELQLHGSPKILELVLGVCLANGARLADNGEFSRRAVIHGKLNLASAEAIADVVGARSDLAHKVALNHLQGGLFKRIQDVRAGLMSLLEQVEGSIDFPDEVPSLDHEKASALLESYLKVFSRIIELKDQGRYIHEGVKVVITGRPNVGKSSLLNQLAGENRAIVSKIPGTTRDFINVQVRLGGILFDFCDTAGIRYNAADEVEQQGIDRVKALISRADLIFWVVDVSQPVQPEDAAVFNLIKDCQNVVMIYNKMDLGMAFDVFDLPDHDFDGSYHSALSDDDGDALKEHLIRWYVGALKDTDLDLVCNIRQIQCVQAAMTHLEFALETVSSGLEDDLLANDLKQAITKLGEITGDEVTEAVLDAVFQRFCVGK